MRLHHILLYKKGRDELKKIWSWILICVMLAGAWSIHVPAADETPEELRNLYARSAVLMDGSSGRILFEKNGQEILPMASTTKIMTCILALENGELQDIVTASENAASQPEVHLGVRMGEEFYLGDILYSLMLESHNDSAVMVAEHIAGSVEQFAVMMNAKAQELGCIHTHYVTPNGLDAADGGGAHSTTAAELALVMSYCVKESPMREEFLKITQTRNYSFNNVAGNRSFSCSNHNAFLDMMEGAVSGKTGFTSAAGYCYVGALERDGRLFVVALLACGWPYNRTYKWKDTRALMEYGLARYQNVEVACSRESRILEVEGGISADGNPWKKTFVKVQAKENGGTDKKKYLLRDDEKIDCRVTIKKKLTAPVEKGDAVGKVVYYLGEEVLEEYPIVAIEAVEKRYLEHCLLWVARMYRM